MSTLMVVGGVALDITATVGKSLATSILHTSTPGHVKHTLGGVGRNVAEAAWRTGANVKLVSVVGDDLAGESVKQGLKAMNMNIDYISTLKKKATAVYNALHSYDGQLVAAVADMDIFDSMDPSAVAATMHKEKPSFVCFDGNITSEMMKTIAAACKTLSIPALFEPTSVPKSLKLFEFAETILSQSVQYTSPNQFELEAMCDTIQAHPTLSMNTTITNTDSMSTKLHAPKLAQDSLSNALFLSKFIPTVFTKLGEEGCLYVDRETQSVQYFPPESIQPQEIISVTGAGDCFVGALIANLQRHASQRRPSSDVLNRIIRNSQLASIRTLKSSDAVSDKIASDLLVS